jgi:hypothetical protein
MRRLIGMAAVALLAAACGTNAQMVVEASGERGQRSFDVGAFEAVEAAGPHNVIVTVGGAPAVRAEGDTALLDRLEVRVENGRLIIGTRRGWSYSGRVEPLTIHVSAPSLTGAGIAGSGDMNVAPFRAPRFSGSIAGSGNLNLGGVQADEARFSIAGSGSVRALGTARQASLSIAGSGDADLGGLRSEQADVSIAGSGDARILATNAAAVSIMGSGNVAVTGGARCRVSKMGSGEVTCG